MDGARDPSQKNQEIQVSLKSIVESSERWLTRLRTREFRVRLASSFLTTILVFAAVGIAGLAYLFSQSNLDTIIQHPEQSYFLIGISGLAGLASGFARYFLLKRKHEAELQELSSLITEMKKTDGGGEGVTQNALALVDKILTILPAIVRKRHQDSLLFGVVSIILTFFFTSNLAAGIIVGVIVWLYFRNEFRRTYEQEISKLEEQKRIFEQRKRDFIENL